MLHCNNSEQNRGQKAKNDERRSGAGAQRVNADRGRIDPATDD